MTVSGSPAEALPLAALLLAALLFDALPLFAALGPFDSLELLAAVADLPLALPAWALEGGCLLGALCNSLCA